MKERKNNNNKPSAISRIEVAATQKKERKKETSLEKKKIGEEERNRIEVPAGASAASRMRDSIGSPSFFNDANFSLYATVVVYIRSLHLSLLLSAINDYEFRSLPLRRRRRAIQKRLSVRRETQLAALPSSPDNQTHNMSRIASQRNNNDEVTFSNCSSESLSFIA